VRLKRRLAYTPTHPSLLPGTFHCSPALCPVTPETTKCPEPLRALKGLPLTPWLLAPRQRALPRRHRSYRLMRQSYPLPPPMVTALVSGSSPVAVSLGWESGPSQRYLHESFPRCLDPYPGGPHGARTRFFPQGIGLPHFLTGSALHMIPDNDFGPRFNFGAAAILSCSSLRVCSPPWSFPPQRRLWVQLGIAALGFGG